MLDALDLPRRVRFPDFKLAGHAFLAISTMSQQRL